jgi:hypothetical protein
MARGRFATGKFTKIILDMVFAPFFRESRSCAFLVPLTTAQSTMDRSRVSHHII